MNPEPATDSTNTKHLKHNFLTRHFIYYSLIILIIATLGVTSYFLLKRLDTANNNLVTQQQIINLRDQYSPLTFDYHTSRGYFPPSQFLSVDYDGLSNSWLYKSTSDVNNTVIYITDRSVFKNPAAVKNNPRCVNMVEIRAKRRDAKPFEEGPVTLTVNKQYKDIMYAYWPKSNICSSLYSNSFLTQTVLQAESISSPY